MQIVCSRNLSILSAVMALVFCLCVSAQAEQPSQPGQPVPGLPAIPSLAAPPTDHSAEGNPSPVASAPQPDQSAPKRDAVANGSASIPTPPLPSTMQGRANNDFDTKVPASVHDVIRRINTADTLTLDDLNAARQAVVKIDALIEVERKINELNKLRQERESGGAAKSLATAIPVSALAPPPMVIPASPPPAQPVRVAEPMAAPPVVAPPAPVGEVVRIIGSEGHYSAVAKSMDQNKIIQVGDHFAGGTVISISTAGVVVDQGKTTQTLHIKNVGNIFTSTR